MVLRQLKWPAGSRESAGVVLISRPKSLRTFEYWRPFDLSQLTFEIALISVGLTRSGERHEHCESPDVHDAAQFTRCGTYFIARLQVHAV